MSMLIGLLLTVLFNIPDGDFSVKPESSQDEAAIVYVSVSGNDKTGVRGYADRPFSTISAAISALPVDGGTVMIGPGEFQSPAHGVMKSHLALMGAGKPAPDWKIDQDKASGRIRHSEPQRLVGGTTLKGTLDCSLLDHIIIKDLGVDVGPAWCKERNRGEAAEGLVFAQKYNLGGGLSGADGIHELQTLSPPRIGILVENVSALCRDARALVHAMLFENLYCPQIANVSTYFGVHGVVIKAQGGQLNNMQAYGHFSNGLILKSNDYAFGRSISVNNVFITSISNGDGGGINLVGERDTLKQIIISDFVVENTRYGIASHGNVDGAILSNGYLLNCSSPVLVVDERLTHAVFSNVMQQEEGRLMLVSPIDYKMNVK